MLSTSFFFLFFISFFFFFFVNVVLLSSGSVQIRPLCPEAEDVLNNIIGLVNAVNKLAASKDCEKAFGKMHFILHASVACKYAWKLWRPRYETPVLVFFFVQLIRTSYVTVISSQFLFLPSVFLFRFNIVF